MSSNRPDYKTAKPLEHYGAAYRKLDPVEISGRCGLVFNPARQAFEIRILGAEYSALYPEFALLDSAGNAAANPCEQILLLRYLCEGKYFPPQGKRIAYNEIPWGGVYYKNFEGRCLKRLAFTFGKNIPAFKKIIGANTRLRAEPLDSGDAAYRLEFINGLYVTVILWGADDEFPPSAQLLFDDNFIFAFTAEDAAVAGEILVERLKVLAV
ncbi:MAG: DUF3786 domain-containing protein [Treponema sp.]|jgi:hypothetical protein|nr:DUF3786 domain-containing protein [Treponema sp.]